MLLEYQNIKTVLQNCTLQIGEKKLLWLKKWKILFSGPMSLIFSTGKKFLYQKELKKANQEEFRIEKVVIEKEINYMLNG